MWPARPVQTTRPPPVPPPSLQQGKTRLYFPKGLQAVYGRKEVWGTSGGFIM